MSSRRFPADAVLILLPGGLLLLVLVLPLSLVLAQFITAGDEALALAHSVYYRQVFLFTAKQAALSTLLALIAGTPGAYFIGRCRFPGRRLLKALATVPFVLPPILAVLGFVLLLGNGGLVNDVRRLIFGPDARPWKMLYSMKAIVLVHVFYNFPLTMRIVGDAWATLPLSEGRAARALGAGRIRAFFTVVLPRLLPGFAAAALITFIYCFMSFSIVLVLGGGPESSTLEVEIYRLIKQQLNFSQGAALAAAESVFLLFLLTLYALTDSNLRKTLKDDSLALSLEPPKLLRGVRLAAALAYLIPAALFILGPLATIIGNSFFSRATWISPAAFSFSHWRRLFNFSESVSLGALSRTAVFSLSVSFFTVCAASALGQYAMRYPKSRKYLESLTALPLGISSIVIGTGWLLLLRHVPNHGAFRLAALGAAHSLSALPFCFRIIYGRLKQLSPQVSKAARVAGASALKTLIHIELPLARPALITAGVFAFALSAGELNASLILAPGSFTTLPIAIYRLIGAYNFHSACALGTVLIIICAVAFYLLDRYGEN
ncbi:MAG: hypothetical protein B0D92_08305 [Spirochaeta sp. LUC14_002_19_P3]|nr:MAG: hypothetical protein B0D92_08305 [Spirochaeta sp. LUC14_002_19_P3]